MVYLREITTNDSQIVTRCVAMTITSGVDAIVMAHTILMSLLNHLSTTFQSTVFLPIAPTQIPSDWDWSAFLQFATEFFIFAFEESDAMERWGSENGRSLRFTGTQIYRSPVDKPGKSKGHVTAEGEITQGKGKLQNQVGGDQSWVILLDNLKMCSRFAIELS